MDDVSFKALLKRLDQDNKALLKKLDTISRSLLKKLDENRVLLQEQWVYQMLRDEVPYRLAGKAAGRRRSFVNAIGKTYKNSKRFVRGQNREDK